MEGHDAIMLYAVAYKDAAGNGFRGQPWLLAPFANIQDLKRQVAELKELRCRDIVPFAFLDIQGEDTEFTWDYVRAHELHL